MLNWIFGQRSKSDQHRQSDRSERNAVIRRIVTAAAKTTPNSTDRNAESQIVGPLVITTDCNTSASDHIPRDRISERAYEIWVRNGRPTGTAEQDWNEAIRELALEMTPVTQ